MISIFVQDTEMRKSIIKWLFIFLIELYIICTISICANYVLDNPIASMASIITLVFFVLTTFLPIVMLLYVMATKKIAKKAYYIIVILLVLFMLQNMILAFVLVMLLYKVIWSYEFITLILIPVISVVASICAIFIAKYKRKQEALCQTGP